MFSSHATAASSQTLVHGAVSFSHADAERLSRLAACFCQRGRVGQRVVIDLHRAEEATTSAFARLVLLRRDLLQHGGDLCVTGLHDRAARLYEVSRLEGILPRYQTAAISTQNVNKALPL